MSTKYSPVNNERRQELIRLIHEEKVTIRQAAKQSNISYPTAKAINRIYMSEGRIEKKKVRVRRPRVHLLGKVVSCQMENDQPSFRGSDQDEKTFKEGSDLDLAEAAPPMTKVTMIKPERRGRPSSFYPL